MRTLVLSLLALLATTFALLSNGAPVSAEPTDKEKSEMAAKVYALLKDKCASCHGADAKKVMGKKGTLNYILDYDKLISEKLIDTASPEKSALYEEISEGNMPRELDKEGKPKNKKKLAQAEIDLVLNWLKAGAPKWKVESSEAGSALAWFNLTGDKQYEWSASANEICQGPSNTLVCVTYWNVKESYATFVWDGKKWEPRTEAVPPESISLSSTAVFDPVRNVTVFIGRAKSSGAIVLCEWNGKTWAERELEGAPPFRSSAAVAYHPARMSIVLFGGATPMEKDDPDSERGWLTHRGINETWELKEDKWSKLDLKNAPSIRYHYVLAYDVANKQLILFEGHSLGSSTKVDKRDDSPAPVWVMETNEWRKVQPLTSLPRDQVRAAIWHPDLKCVVGCGWQRVSEKNHRESMPVFAWDGKTWAELSVKWPKEHWTIGNPNLVWDAANSAVVLIGGEDTGNNANSRVWALMPIDWKRK